MGAIETFDIRKCVTDSVIKTCSTLLSLEIEPLQEEPLRGTGVQRMVGTLHFAGTIAGFFNLQVAVDFGRIMAANKLDVQPDEVDLASDVRDLIAEITHIVGGNLKSALYDAGYFCVLSAPSITYGSDFTIKALPMDRFERCLFGKDDHLLMVEVGLKTVEGAETDPDFSTPDAMSRLSSVDIEKLDAIDYPGKLSGTVSAVFQTLFALKLEAAETVSAASLTGLRDVSSVCFAGDATGIVSIHVDKELARRMAANMLGMGPDEIEGEGKIQDMLGELGNRVGGTLKSALTETGLRCALSTPAITTGSDFMIETMNLDRYESCAFHAEGHSVFAEMGVKISERVKAAQEPAAAAGAQTASMSGSGARKQPGRAKAPKPLQPPPEDFGLDILVDIPVELTVELGRTKLPIHDLLKLQPGSAIKLARLEGEPVDILANDVLIARGEVVVRNEKYGIRITEITSRVDRLKGLS
jgi:flagellar motor switch protein FliN